MKSFSNKIASIFLATMVVLSTLSFTIEKHYCGDNLIDVAIFTKLQRCGDNDMASETSTMKKSCCKDEVKLVQGQDELKATSFDDLKHQQQLFLHSFVFSYVALYEVLPKKSIPHKYYSPPDIVQDIHVLDEVYLI